VLGVIVSTAVPLTATHPGWETRASLRARSPAPSRGRGDQAGSGSVHAVCVKRTHLGHCHPVASV
jgi:hypothetical protein